MDDLFLKPTCTDFNPVISYHGCQCLWLGCCLIARDLNCAQPWRIQMYSVAPNQAPLNSQTWHTGKSHAIGKWGARASPPKLGSDHRGQMFTILMTPWLLNIFYAMESKPIKIPWKKNSRHIVISKSIIYHSCSTFTSKVQCLQFHPDVPYPTTLEMPAGQFRPPTSAAQIALLRFRERWAECALVSAGQILSTKIWRNSQTSPIFGPVDFTPEKATWDYTESYHPSQLSAKKNIESKQ